MKVSSPKQKGLTDYEKGMSVLTRTKSMEKKNIKENNFAQWVINVNCHFSKKSTLKSEFWMTEVQNTQIISNFETGKLIFFLECIDI